MVEKIAEIFCIFIHLVDLIVEKTFKQINQNNLIAYKKKRTKRNLSFHSSMNDSIDRLFPFSKLRNISTRENQTFVVLLSLTILRESIHHWYYFHTTIFDVKWNIKIIHLNHFVPLSITMLHDSRFFPLLIHWLEADCTICMTR